MNKIKEFLSCSLSSVDAAQQLLEWKKLRSYATKTTEIDNGYQLIFPSKFETQINELSAKESACCQFLNIETRTVDDEIVLDITSESKKAKPIMMLISGAET